MSIRRALVVLTGLVVVLAGCAPTPAAGSTDTLDLGSLGRYAEPAYDVSATAAESYSPRGPRSITLTVVARDADGNIVRSFTMRENNVSDTVTPVAVGSFPGVLAPPHTRDFTVSEGFAGPAVSTLFGQVDISELTFGAVSGSAGGPIYDVTHLRASFRGVYDAYGPVSGYFTIG